MEGKRKKRLKTRVKDRIVANLKFYIRQRIRLSRGESWFDAIKKPLALISGIGIINETIFVRYFDYALPFFFYPMIVIIAFVGSWFVGWIDQKYGLTQYEAGYQTRKLNDEWAKLFNDVIGMKKKINKLFLYHKKPASKGSKRR